MNRWTVLFVAMLAFALAAMGCSGGGQSPVAPTTDLGISGATVQTVQSQTHLWGYYDCYIDIENQTVEAVENRSTAFAANVVQFVNGNPANLSFNIKDTPIGTDYIDVDIDVSIRHPFPGMSQYNGYDVRGIFCGDGSDSLDYSGDLDYPVFGTDQFMFNKPGDDVGGPDGYTRWFNKSEFGTPGLGGYTPGLFASKGFNGSATLMPYKYFADGLSATGDLWDFLMGTDDSGVFAAGKTNTRNYYLRFPNAKGVKYGYAIVANWIDETTHPANAPEAVGCKAEVTDDIYFVNSTSKGGDLIADISLWGWTMQPDKIFIESNMFAMHELNATEMIPTASGTSFATYHVEIPTTSLTGTAGNEFWVIAELDGYDYTSSFGIPNSAGADKLAGFFRYDVFVADTPYNQPPVITSGITGEEEPIEWTTETYTVVATDPDSDPLTYSWTVSDGNGDPVEDYDGVAGDGAGNLDIDWGAVAGWTQGPTEFTIECNVSDGAENVDATPLEAEVWVEGDLWVSNHTDFNSVPDNGTQSQPYSNINQAMNSGYQAGAKIIVDAGSTTYTDYINRNSANGFTLRSWCFYTTPYKRAKLTVANSYAIYLSYTNNVTIRGFDCEWPLNSYQYYYIYGYQCTNLEVYDNYFHGTTVCYYVNAFYTNYCTNFVFENNLFADLNCNNTWNQFQMGYAYNNYTYTSVSFNEMTNLQPNQNNTANYVYGIQAYYIPATSKFNNNLIHHISPNSGPSYEIYMYLMYLYYPYSTVTIANNTIDKADGDHAWDYYYTNVYGMYIYNGGSSSNQYDCNSNIVTNIGGTYTMPYYIGISAYNISPDYCDVWNVQDNPYENSSPGPNCMAVDPQYENNTTAPYDYRLKSTSPLIGEGKLGVDMGCYGNLGPGQSVGLQTPK